MNVLSRICSSVLLIIGFTALGFADEHFPFLAIASKDSVNVRAGANTNFEQIDKLHMGQEIVVLGKSFDWYKVQLSAQAKAFIRADYLNVHQDLIADVDGDKVNIRAAANSEAASIGQVTHGTLVKVVLQENGWCQIVPPPQASGWVRQDMLSFKSQSIEPSLIRAPVALPAQEKTE